MRNLFPLALGMGLLLAGCTKTVDREPDGRLEMALADWFNESAVSGAILTQHTVFPYHFVVGAAALNDLGRHDLRVLAAYLKEHPGPLNVRRGQASQELYTARVVEVTRFLTEAGVPAQRIAIGDALPGGDGMPSERVVKILERSAAGPATRMTVTPLPYTGMAPSTGAP